MVRTFLEGFERSVLFRLTRFMAMAAIIVLLCIIAGGGVVIGMFFHSTDPHVSPDEVVSSLKQAVASNNKPGSSQGAPVLEGNTSAEQPLKLPFLVQKYMDEPQNLATLKDWLSGLTSSEKAEFLDEMAQTIAAAEKAHVDPIDAINKFRTLKLTKLAANKDTAEQRITYVVWYASATVSALVLIALLSLILVLLAVERNTRQAINA